MLWVHEKNITFEKNWEITHHNALDLQTLFPYKWKEEHQQYDANDSFYQEGSRWSYSDSALDYDTICTISSELERATSAHATWNPWLWSTSWEDVQDWKPSGGRFGLSELAHMTSYMETSNSSEEQPTLSSNQEWLLSEQKEDFLIFLFAFQWIDQ
jgi:hypothetical protein